MVSKKLTPAKKPVPVKKTAAAKKAKPAPATAAAKKVKTAKPAVPAKAAKKKAARRSAGGANALPYTLVVCDNQLVMRPAGGGDDVVLEDIVNPNGATLTLQVRVSGPAPSVAEDIGLLEALNNFLKSHAEAGILADATTTNPDSAPPASKAKSKTKPKTKSKAKPKK